MGSSSQRRDNQLRSGGGGKMRLREPSPANVVQASAERGGSLGPGAKGLVDDAAQEARIALGRAGFEPLFGGAIGPLAIEGKRLGRQQREPALANEPSLDEMTVGERDQFIAGVGEDRGIFLDDG